MAWHIDTSRGRSARFNLLYNRQAGAICFGNRAAFGWTLGQGGSTLNASSEVIDRSLRYCPRRHPLEKPAAKALTCGVISESEITPRAWHVGWYTISGGTSPAMAKQGSPLWASVTDQASCPSLSQNWQRVCVSSTAGCAAWAAPRTVATITAKTMACLRIGYGGTVAPASDRPSLMLL